MLKLVIKLAATIAAPVLRPQARYLTNFTYDLNKFNDIHIKQSHLDTFNKATNSNPSEFEKSLKNSVDKWSTEKR